MKFFQVVIPFVFLTQQSWSIKHWSIDISQSRQEGLPPEQGYDKLSEKNYSTVEFKMKR